MPDLNGLQDKINFYAEEYDRKTFERHVAGEEKYGAGTWLGTDTMEHAKDEVLDLGNYAKFTYIKLCLFQEKLALLQADGSTAQARPDYNGPLSQLHTGGMPQ